MGVQVNDSGDMQVTLAVKDEGSAVVAKFAENVENSLGGASQKIDAEQQQRLEAFKKEGEAAKGAAGNYDDLGKGIAKTIIAIGTIAAGVAAEARFNG